MHRDEDATECNYTQIVHFPEADLISNESRKKKKSESENFSRNVYRVFVIRIFNRNSTAGILQQSTVYVITNQHIASEQILNN